LNSIERLDLWNPTQWDIVKGGELHKKGCFTMYPMNDVSNMYDLNVKNKVLIFGGWKPHANLADVQLIDTVEEDYKNIGKFAQ
jgi:hypothetical protein